MDQMVGRAIPDRSTRRLAERTAKRTVVTQPAVRPQQRGTRAMAQALPAQPARWRQILLGRGPRELASVLVVTLAYFLTRGLVRGREADAFRHATELLQLERLLHLDWESPLQALALNHSWLLTFVNDYYLVGHLPVLIGVALWLFFWRSQVYPWFRNAFIFSATIGLAIYVWLPMAPPRFLPGFTDTMRLYGFDVDGSAAGLFYNPYAAMPSLHTGWSLLAGVAIFVTVRHWWGKALGVLLPTLMVLSVIMTGNHYVLDAVAGAAVTVLALALATLVERGTRNSGREMGSGKREAVGAR
jgi:membrane-associated phospholipid phosphatase